MKNRPEKNLSDRQLRHDFNRARNAVNDNDVGGLDPSSMPRWNLAGIYPALDSDALAKDKAEIVALANEFAENYEGTISWLSGAELGDAIKAYEQIEIRRHKISSYMLLLESDDVANFAKTGDLKKWYQDTSGITAFFEYEIAEMKESAIMSKLSAPELGRYAPWLAAIREDSKNPLPDDVVSLSVDFDAANRAGWLRLYHETINYLKVDFRGKKLSLDDVSEEISSGKATLAERQEARAAMAAALRDKSKRVALIYNTIIRDDMIDADLRGFTRPDQQVNQQNRVDNEIVDTMFTTIKASYSQLSHRFYAWKAEQHGVDVLPRAQVGMELPGLEGASRSFTFDEGKKTVMKAFRKFSPKFARLAEKIFSAGHIDAAPREGKEGGAFALPSGPGNVPYIMLNFTGGVDDVASSLGHELGHGIHQQLSEKACGFFLSDVPTPVAETASIFSEMLVFDELLKAEKDPAIKKRLLVDRLENMLGNGLQQLAYYDFEKRVHAGCRKGEMDAEAISDIWVATQKEYFGPSVETDDYDRYYWMAVPHLFDTPFYVYSYAFAQQVVSGLYQVYKQAEAEGKEARDDFIESYIGLLETGMTKNLYEMFQPFDLDPETPEFWKNGLQLADKYLDELVKLDATPAAKPVPKAKRAPKS